MQKRTQGLTLLELLTACVVLGVLAAIAGPYHQSFLARQMLHDATEHLFSAIHLTRSEAIKRNVHVTLCKSADGFSCSSAGGWEQGWIVFEDLNHNASRDHDEVIIHSAPAKTGALRISGNTPVANYIAYTPFGHSRLAASGFQAGSITVCQTHAAGQRYRKIVISSLGRAKMIDTIHTHCE